MLLDRWLIDKFEQFSHWWQKTTGHSCFWLAKAFTAIGVINSAVNSWIIFKYGRGDDSDFIGIWIIGLIFGLLFVTLLPWIFAVEEEVHKYTKFVNSLRLQAAPRIMMVVIPCNILTWITVTLLEGFAPYAPPLFIRICGVLPSVWYIIVVYFTSCTPLPPAKSKVRKWLKSALNAAKTALDATKEWDAPSPEPVPSPVPVGR